jgi:UDP-3-O-[3-hydroxymyristoyl] glucosamine N-acyltransferase
MIGRGSKLDNQIQIGHNVHLGEDCALAGCVGIAGSTSLGDRVMVGGSAGILGHLTIADDVVIAAMSLISQSISQPGVYGGVFPQMPQKQAERSAAVLKQLPSFRTRVMRLEAAVDQFLGSDESE